MSIVETDLHFLFRPEDLAGQQWGWAQAAPVTGPPGLGQDGFKLR